jgi:uroporphyrinogen III methyltransferase/synthase
MELAGKTILITRAASQSEALRTSLEAAGARVLEYPLLEIIPNEEWTEVDRTISQLDTYDWVIFTSTNAVEFFLRRLRAAGKTCRVPIAAVGSSTAEKLAAWKVSASLVPASFRAEGLLEVFPADLRGKRILIPRAVVAKELLPDELRRRGAMVDVLPVYRTARAESGSLDLREALRSESVDALVLTSPSAVHFLGEILGEEAQAILSSTVIAVIGPVAAAAAKELGLSAAIQPRQATIPDLVDAIRGYFSSPEQCT